jgi:aspartyl-tRNA synthetase
MAPRRNLRGRGGTLPEGKQRRHAGTCALFAFLTSPPPRDPFRASLEAVFIMHRYRSHTCGALRESDIGKSVRLAGWCHRIRDHGGLLFIDLRDHYGLTQVVADPDSPAFKAAEQLRSEWVVRIDGEVRKRPAGTENPDLATGAVEVFISEIEVLGPADELPLPVFGDQEYPEDIRLKYRFLDLRRERLHHNIMQRGAIIDSLRRRMKEQGFFEFQTPILTASSPEGARDFLVPSRLHPGKFYALPQAPQQFKQLLMVAGFDRYFQIAPCFRDEDPRADRLPGEFYQLDIEMSFVTQDDVFTAMEPVLRGTFAEFAGGWPVTQTLPRITHRDALRKYGTDKPDLRNPLVIADVSEEFNDPSVTFNAFKNVIKAGGVVRAIPAPGAGAQPRSFFDKLNEWARTEMGAPGLGYIVFEADGGKGPIAKFIPADIQARLAAKAGIKPGDALFFSAGKEADAAKLAGAARTRIGEELGLVDKERFELAWIVDFPMYEWDETEKKVDFSHNPFSMPQGGLEALTSRDPVTIDAYQYDMVCNGYEIASGAIRNHSPEIMKKAFAIAGYDEAVLQERFGGMYRAFSYGAPPHGGMAAGVDRMVMLLCHEQNLREVALFPMTQRAEDLLMGAPSEVSQKQLRELHIRLNLPDKRG